MKNIKYIFILFCGTILAQTHSESIADVVVAGQKNTAIAGLLGAELALRNAQAGLIKALEETEEDYNSKRSVAAGLFANTLVIGAVQTQLAFLTTKIRNVKSNINTLKIASFGVGQGLSRYMNEVETEEKYVQKLHVENGLLIAGLGISGGTGHVYTAYLKLLIRLIPIKNKILQIDKDIKAKMTFTRILAK